MNMDLLDGKKVLIVDDEKDIIESIEELLEKCVVDSAVDFNSAKELLANNKYDVAILDVMGVNGYELLEIANENQLPAIILTAHALSAEYFKKSIRQGAFIYLPKDEIVNIAEYLEELFGSMASGNKKSGRWFYKLSPSFDKKFGKDWKEKDKSFWRDFTHEFRFTREELEEIL